MSTITLPSAPAVDIGNWDNGLMPPTSVGFDPDAKLLIGPEDFRSLPSGDLFGPVQNFGMGADRLEALWPNIAIISTAGGLPPLGDSRGALGLHTGHFELHQAIRKAADMLRKLNYLPFSMQASDQCDGRTQGTKSAGWSLPSRDTLVSAMIMQVAGLPRAEGVIGIGTCDKGLPAILMTIASLMVDHDGMPGAVVPGGVTLPVKGGIDLGAIQTVGARFSTGHTTLDDARAEGCRSCGTPGGGCQFLGTAATMQVIAEAMGLTPFHSALSPSGFPIWHEAASNAAIALVEMRKNGLSVRDVLTPQAIKNAIMVHAAFGGSSNAILHIPAIARAGGLDLPTVDDFADASRKVTRIVDTLPNGGHPTINAFLAGGVPEVMYHLARQGLIDTDCLTIYGVPLGQLLDSWINSERRQRLRDHLFSSEAVDPDNVILTFDKAKEKGFVGTLAFPRGNITPEGSLVKATGISPTLYKDGVYDRIFKARVFTSEDAAIEAIKSKNIKADEGIVLLCRGPKGAGMPETYQITSALKKVPEYAGTPLITDGRFSGVSTGPCIGHISPEAMTPGAPVGKLQDGDMIRIIIDTNNGFASLNFVGEKGSVIEQEAADRLLEARPSRSDLRQEQGLHRIIRAWGELQEANGGIWAGAYSIPKA